MPKPLELDSFLDRNRIERGVWEKCDISWDVLQAIAEDHEGQIDRLRDSADLFARAIQRFPSVHSVRWRIKDTEHLLAKIIRKRADGQEKYRQIDAANYFELVTDLVGLRALHLFKDDCFTIDSSLRQTWTPTESPTAYVREGDPQDLTNRFQDRGFAVKQHPAGYRSVHYVLSTQPLQRKVFAEVQVRTIFEEGWSEIDHQVRYPNFSDNELVAYFLTIFNRLAGSADEMGTFVQGLTGVLRAFDDKLSEANRQKELALSSMERVIGDLDAMKRQDADTKEKVAALQTEIAKLRSVPSLSGIFSKDDRTVLAALGGLEPRALMSDLARLHSRPVGLGLAALPTETSLLKKALEEASTTAAIARAHKDKK